MGMGLWGTLIIPDSTSPKTPLNNLNSSIKKQHTSFFKCRPFCLFIELGSNIISYSLSLSNMELQMYIISQNNTMGKLRNLNIILFSMKRVIFNFILFSKGEQYAPLH